MDTMQLDNDDNFVEEKTLKQFLTSGTCDVKDIFADPQVNPRVGDEYQVQVPPFITEADHLHISSKPNESFVIGLPIPIMWVPKKTTWVDSEVKKLPSKPDHGVDAKGVVENGKRKKIHFTLKKKGSGPIDLGALEKKKRGKRPLPGLSSTSWNDTEVESFILGLYIFGKNFVQIRTFVESKKKIGDILSFYYGIFYRSDAHRRWSGCKKAGSRKRTIGQRIFTGWRQHVLLSRLLPHVKEESKRSLLEVSMSFADGKTSLEEYVSSLKSNVGMKILVESVAIGKGKEDLTVLTMESGKIDPVFPVCPKIPSGKACSSLTCSDIVKFLSGDFRLSKARCNDIFWEAVWPRLLARGWHSEQPKNQGYVSSKHCLIFLMPGVKRFLRRKLVKGEHYFDTVSDVLSKVALEPELLELEAEENMGRSCDKNGWDPEVTSDPDDLSDKLRHCYLKPRFSATNPNQMMFTVVDTSLPLRQNSSGVKEMRCLPIESKMALKQASSMNKPRGNVFRNSKNDFEPIDEKPKSNSPDRMKFTIIDTSLDHGGKSCNMRELRCSPFENIIPSKLTSLSKKTEEKNYLQTEQSKHGLDVPNMPSDGENITDKVTCREHMKESKYINHKASIDKPDTEKKTVETDQNHQINSTSHEQQQAKKTIKHQFSRRVKTCCSDFVGPIVKRRRLTACAKSETSNIGENLSRGSEPEQARIRLVFKAAKTDSKVVSQMDPTLKPESNVVSQTGPELIADNNALSQMGPGLKESWINITDSQEVKSSENVVSKNCFGVQNKDEDKTRSLIDLNQPQMPLESGTGDLEGIQKESSPCLPDNANNSHSPKKLEVSVNVNSGEQHLNMNSRRQSTRNRPLTLKALEAFENGFLHVQRKQEGRDDFSKGKPFSTSSRKPRSRVKGTSSHSTTTTGLRISPLKEENEMNQD